MDVKAYNTYVHTGGVGFRDTWHTVPKFSAKSKYNKRSLMQSIYGHAQYTGYMESFHWSLVPGIGRRHGGLMIDNKMGP
jgi:hypothetical protein